jgi:acetylglutamate/LysW-gamma-L-alpha-aminoadipate kinase
VHGGGAEVTEISSKLGKQQQFIMSPEGFRSRYTDKETIDIYTMVMAGKLNKQIVLALAAQAYRLSDCRFRCPHLAGGTQKAPHRRG